MEPEELNEELMEFSYFEVMAGQPIGDVTRSRVKGCSMVVELDADDFGDDEQEGRQIALANARMIAAAPELLDALEHIMRCIPMGGFAQIHHGSSTWEQIDAAVSKARGELFNTMYTAPPAK